MKLIQLPNGDWISPATVTAIVPLEAIGNHAERVVVRTDDGAHICYVADNDSLHEMRDRIANQVNAGR